MDHPLSICGYETNLLIAFNRFIKTQFDHNKNQSLSFKPIEPFSPRKTFPHSTDEGTMPAFLG